MELEFRNGIIEDKEWIFSLYVLTMKIHIEKTWGWNENFQRNVFNSNLHPTKFQIVSIDGVVVGVYLMVEKNDHLWLEMLLVYPEKQNTRIGTLIVDKLKKKSIDLMLPLKLSVIKVNPVISFYEKMGFTINSEDQDFYNLEWKANV